MSDSKEFGINLRRNAERVFQAFEKDCAGDQNHNDMECECAEDEQELATNKEMKDYVIYLLIYSQDLIYLIGDSFAYLKKSNYIF